MITKLYLSYIKDNLDHETVANGSLGKPLLDANLANYFSNKTVGDLVNDVFLDVKSLEGKILNGVKYSELMDAFCDYLIEKIIFDLDKIGLSHFVSKHDDKVKSLDEKFDNNGALNSTIKSILLSSTYEKVQDSLQDFVLKIKKSLKNVLIVSARECSSELKKEIRNEFNDSFIVFKVDTSLLGGMLMHVNGKIMDQSYLGKISLFK